MEAALDKTIEKIAAGLLPHGATVLKALFNKMKRVKVRGLTK